MIKQYYFQKLLSYNKRYSIFISVNANKELSQSELV